MRADRGTRCDNLEVVNDSRRRSLKNEWRFSIREKKKKRIPDPTLSFYFSFPKSHENGSEDTGEKFVNPEGERAGEI